MMSKCRRMPLAWLVLALGCAGCGTYWRNRGNDALDMWDFGLSTSSRPGLAFLPADYMNVTPIGFSFIEGTFHGVYRRKWGTFTLSDSMWGVLVTGSQTLQVGEFDVSDPDQFHPAKIAALKAAGKPLPTAPQRYNLGLLTVPLHDNAPPYPNWFS
ncbi:MAG: hypothetical protein FJ291_29980 [Planctomycetes bacterium]|nr:hypothetical protein [Planctomycetota bacterium]